MSLTLLTQFTDILDCSGHEPEWGGRNSPPSAFCNKALAIRGSCWASVDSPSKWRVWDKLFPWCLSRLQSTYTALCSCRLNHHFIWEPTMGRAIPSALWTLSFSTLTLLHELDILTTILWMRLPLSSLPKVIQLVSGRPYNQTQADLPPKPSLNCLLCITWPSVFCHAKTTIIQNSVDKEYTGLHFRIMDRGGQCP